MTASAAKSGWPGDAQDGLDVGEILLEAARCDQLDEADRLVAGVPEGVLDASRLDDGLAGAGLADLVADLHAEQTGDHVRDLVLVGVRVQG